MSIEDLKAQLAGIPGIQGLTMTTVAGRDNYGLDGLLISVDPTKGQDEVAAEIRKAVAARVSLPPISFTTTTGRPSMTASFAASLRAMMDDARADLEKAREDGKARVTQAMGEYGKAKTAIMHVTGTMAKMIEDETAAVMSDLGQVSNDLGLSETQVP